MANKIAIRITVAAAMAGAALVAVAAPAAFANRNAILQSLGAGGVESAAPSADMAAGYQAIDAGDYEAALAAFGTAVEADPGNAEAYNELGYVHRRLQDFDQAFAYYRRALEIDPELTGAHQYIGEAYLEVGNLEMAEYHLSQLDLICLFGCDDYYELEQAVALYKANIAG